MPQEIERKFLVNRARWEAAVKPEGRALRQGYLLADADKTIRVRIAGNRGYLTLKGKTEGATRAEFEYEIPADEATELLDRFAVSELAKTRYRVPVGRKTWDVDVFSGKNEGLLLAEVELEDEDEPFELPDWAGEEVTHDARYYNSNLSLKPFSEW